MKIHSFLAQPFLSFFLFSAMSALIQARSVEKVVDLSGSWTVRLDSLDKGMDASWQGLLFDQTVDLPGTTDQAGLGVANTLLPALTKPQLTYLTRKFRYVGPVWYSREFMVPKGWTDKEFVLQLERVLWDSQVWIDGQPVKGHEESLVSPHKYCLTPYIKPGNRQVITLRVDNRKRYDISNGMAHAYTDHTQIIWNGVLGEMKIRAEDQIAIENVELYPDRINKKVRAKIRIANRSKSVRDLSCAMTVKGKRGRLVGERLDVKVNVPVTGKIVEIEYPLGENIECWDEFNPFLYTAEFELGNGKEHSVYAETFGIRDIRTDGNRMLLNGRPVFLRGTLECCIFPLTGTPPTDKKGWLKVFKSAQSYGLNHLRFHSWCPPEAAFDVADELGMYLQIELPVWALTIGQDTATVRFLQNEAERIRREYGNHPSFCLWSMGNELEGDFSVLSNLVDTLKSKDKRHLYTTTSFTFKKGHGDWPEENDDYFVTQWTKKGWVRGQGVFNQEWPSFDKNYNASVEGMKVPLITHEIGQYSVYPDLKEIKKYTGVLEPLNFKAIREDLKRKGLLDKADDYLQASGQLAAILYKEEIERALKTAGISGFQLLDLHDFPGQGTALVGLLNAFWESKGIISGNEFSRFCSPVVPLLNFPKAVYTNNETFVGRMALSNYSQLPMTAKRMKWSVSDDDKILMKGHSELKNLHVGYDDMWGTVEFPLNQIKKATRLTLKLELEGTDYENTWHIWVYPQYQPVEWGKVKYTRSYDEAEQWLKNGCTVLLNPDWKQMKGIEGKFVPVFWSPVHFPNQAGTMGVLCDPQHPALSDFPTAFHSDWQWWDLNIHSTTLVTDSLCGGTPVVEMVDNFANNRRLASLYEGAVGTGKLMVATFDLSSELEERPVALQMLRSLLRYMNSSDFNPDKLENFEKLKEYIGTGKNEKQSAESIY